MHSQQGFQAQTCPATQSRQKESSPVVLESQDGLTKVFNAREQFQQHWTEFLHCHLPLIER